MSTLYSKLIIHANQSQHGVVFSPQVSGSWAPLTSMDRTPSTDCWYMDIVAYMSLPTKKKTKRSNVTRFGVSILPATFAAQPRVFVRRSARVLGPSGRARPSRAERAPVLLLREKRLRRARKCCMQCKKSAIPVSTRGIAGRNEASMMDVYRNCKCYMQLISKSVQLE